MKRKRCNFDFVEVMACPSGCLNGGAQLRPQDGEYAKEMVVKMEETFQAIPKELPKDNKTVSQLYNEWLIGRETDKAQHLLYTDYHEVEKLTNPLAMKW